MKPRMRKKKVLFIAPFLSSFVKNDILILSKNYNVKTNINDWSKKYLTPFYLIYQFFHLAININSASKIIISFGGYWSFLPAIFGKVFNVPVFIILHGTDCASLPNINYGSLRKSLVRYFCKKSYELASVLLPVSSSLVSIKNTYFSDDEYSYQGYKYYFPKNRTEYKILPNGLDEKFWHISNGKKEDNSFIAVFSKDQFFLKGGDLIVNLANKLNNCKFYIAGISKEDVLNPIPQNVVLLGKITPEELRDFYSECRFSLQLSIFEGFGLALCEAMLCECIPIGSSVNIIPEIIGKTGFVMEKKDEDEFEKIVRKALANEEKDELGKMARSQVINNYSMDKRREDLLSILEKQRIN